MMLSDVCLSDVCLSRTPDLSRERRGLQEDQNWHSGSPRTSHVTRTPLSSSVIFVNENENENYQKRKNNDFVNEN